MTKMRKNADKPRKTKKILNLAVAQLGKIVDKEPTNLLPAGSRMCLMARGAGEDSSRDG